MDEYNLHGRLSRRDMRPVHEILEAALSTMRKEVKGSHRLNELILGELPEVRLAIVGDDGHVVVGQRVEVDVMTPEEWLLLGEPDPTRWMPGITREEVK